MKYIKMSMLFCLWLVSLGIVGAYELQKQDYVLLDSVEDRLFDVMEEKNIAVEYVVSLIEQYMAKNSISSKTKAILGQLVEDITYVFGDESWPIEWRYMLPEDCLADELYSEDDEWCYPREESLDSYDAKHTHRDESDDDLPIYDAFLLQEGKLIQLEGDQLPEHDLIWWLFSQLIPEQARKDLVSINFGDNKKSDTYAYVEQTNEDYRKRSIVFNIPMFVDDSGDLIVDEAIHTIIHEFAHILTLDDSQVDLLDPYAEEEILMAAERNCQSYFLSEWCAYRLSYIAQYIDKFWDDEELSLAWEDEQPDVYSEEEYVSDYAATNPWEDIAESFTHFILESKPKWSSERDQKVLFFYQFPELLKLRSTMRARTKELTIRE